MDQPRGDQRRAGAAAAGRARRRRGRLRDGAGAARARARRGHDRRARRRGCCRATEPFAGELLRDGVRGGRHHRAHRPRRRPRSRRPRRRRGHAHARRRPRRSSPTRSSSRTGRRPAPTRPRPGDGRARAGHGTSTVDDSLRCTAVDGGWLYAVGDVNGRNLLTHMGKYQARVVRRRHRRPRQRRAATTRRRCAATADDAAVPQVVFTDPQVCSVGLTEAQAAPSGPATSGRRVRHRRASPAPAAGRRLPRPAKLVVDEDRRVVVGATFVGPESPSCCTRRPSRSSARSRSTGSGTRSRRSRPCSEVWLRLLETYGL